MTMNLNMQNVLVLKRMYELRNVRLVAESMGKTSGAISKNLTKMKAQLDDPLFIQTKNGFEPTSFVEANMPHFEQILASVDAIKPQEFSPTHFTGEVSIYANTLFWDRFGDKLYIELIKQAPNARYAFLRWGADARNRIIDGENAIAIHYFDEDLPQSIAQKELGKGKAVFFVRNDHPARDFQSLSDYALLLFKTPGWNDHKYPLLDRLKNIGFDVTPKVEVEHPAMIHSIIMQTDHFGITMSGNVPERCRSIDLPNGLELGVSFVMSCRRSQQHDPQNQWLFNVIQTIIAKHSKPD
ncbi:LysR family transcriptional regulator [Vibrio sp. Sgm 5]|uniref:LysR family transcriptional regulator n=1 Tax=Vibrio sp. Sgm 5 TaxID=2994387 RepID=UPI002248F50B|nr:LysR family transcriptional regulator [Vibrio sp. Sgm 5]MCX2791667.1 LysR family transcriptional regulator [Vibrio sp. Sgm 5]